MIVLLKNNPTELLKKNNHDPFRKQKCENFGENLKNSGGVFQDEIRPFPSTSTSRGIIARFRRKTIKILPF